MSKPEITIYTDGGCEPNPGIGGWASVVIYKGQVKEISGGEMETTNNRMELLSVISALEGLSRPCIIKLHTDSKYVKNGIMEWMPKWKKNGWKTSANKPVKNKDFWCRLNDAVQRHIIEFTWVKGHSGNTYNERCDVLCTREISKWRDC